MDFNKLQLDILDSWKENSCFTNSNVGKTDFFSFYDGPPFATGNPHYGHLLAGSIKDVVCRFHSMNNKFVERRFGWDCHGLPLENQAQKFFTFDSLKIFAKDNDNVKNFNAKCVELINNCSTSWKETSDLLGRWIDFDNCYRTMDPKYMESVWWVFKQLFNQGRIVKQSKVLPYSPKLQTSLSNSESSHYQNVQGIGLYLVFNVLLYKVLVYTTTPWTLPMNSGICVNKTLYYSLVNNEFVLATNLVSSLFPTYDSCVDFDISQLIGQSYTTPFSYFSTTGKVVEDSFVTDTDGTGIVHLAPAYGEDDFRVGSRDNLDINQGLDDECKFLPVVYDFSGKFCFDANKDVLTKLNVFKLTTIQHNYPYCERTNTPLVYKLQDGWVLKLQDVKEKLVKNNQEVNWVPEAIGKARFHNWLLEAKDWNLSRSRLWGTPLPLWISNDGDVLCIGSFEELNSLHSGEPVTNLHKEYIDQLVLTKDGKEYSRVPEVLDCWFESGCMPYGQLHYPFENQDLFNKTFPADFIAEGLDQTRGWFYSLLVIGTLLFDKSPYKNVIVNGMVLAEDGQKMSKSKKNYPDPKDILHKYGADAVRAYLCSSGAVQASSLKFSEKDVNSVNKNLSLPLLSALNFHNLHVNNHKSRLGLSQLDHYLQFKVNELTDLLRKAYDSYNLSTIVTDLSSFVDQLNNWYIRYSRKNLYNNQDSFEVFHDVLLTLSKLMAPLMPFISEHMYQSLTNSTESVHLQNYPELKDINYSFDMVKVQQLTNVLNNHKTINNLSLNSSIDNLFLFRTDLTDEEMCLFKEINHVSNVVLSLGDDLASFVRAEYSANFKTLGPKLSKDMKEAVVFIKSLTKVEFPLVFKGHYLDKGDVNIKYTPLDSKDQYYTDSFADILIKG